MTLTPTQLWEMNPVDFNKWRRENDLKHLFDVFQKSLPKFNEWLSEFGLTIDFILESNKPGQFFYWDTETFLVHHDNSFLFLPIESDRQERSILKTNKSEGSKIIKFTPYFLWAKRLLKTDEIIKTAFGGGYDTFRYTVRTAPDVPLTSSTTMVPGVTLLKLGGTKLTDGWGKLCLRNLDFTDLDFLEVEGERSLSVETNICFASCRNFKITNAKAFFTFFYQCHFENLQISNSSVDGFIFLGCDLFKGYFENCRLTNFVFENCSINLFSFNRVDIESLQYIPPKEEWHCYKTQTYETVKDNFKRFRVLFQGNGLRHEASEAYYNERKFELKYDLSIIDLKSTFKQLKYSKSAFFQSIKKNIRTIGKCISQTCSFLVWGFGERPGRVFAASLILMTMYTLVYFFSSIPQLHHKIVDSIYLSVIIFSTLGFGDYSPIADGTFKLLIASEALLGAFFLGLFVAGYANKAKY